MSPCRAPLKYICPRHSAFQVRPKSVHYITFTIFPILPRCIFEFFVILVSYFSLSYFPVFRCAVFLFLLYYFPIFPYTIFLFFLILFAYFSSYSSRIFNYTIFTFFVVLSLCFHYTLVLFFLFFLTVFSYFWSYVSRIFCYTENRTRRIGNWLVTMYTTKVERIFGYIKTKKKKDGKFVTIFEYSYKRERMQCTLGAPTAKSKCRKHPLLRCDAFSNKLPYPVKYSSNLIPHNP